MKANGTGSRIHRLEAAYSASGVLRRGFIWAEFFCRRVRGSGIQCPPLRARRDRLAEGRMSTQQTRNRGATKAGDGRFLFDFAELARIPVGEGYSTAEGPVVEGERMQVGLITIRRGTASRRHSHTNEQWRYVLKGRARVSVGGQPETVASPGMLIYAPPNVVHSVEALPEEDLMFFTVKDLSHGIVGTPAG